MPLDLIEGALPADLAGHLYVASPAGTVDQSPQGALFVGDGMVSRFDLDPGGVKLSTRLVRGHDFVADELTASDPALAEFRFASSGIARLGRLGVRNFSNTAVVPMKFGAEPTRIAMTYDAARPVEIDPASLEYVTPIGRRSEWDPEALPGAVFPMVLSPAHPFFDPTTSEFFTLNYGRGVMNFAGTIPILALLRELPRQAVDAFDKLATVFGVDRAYHWLLGQIRAAALRLDMRAEDFVVKVLPEFVPDSFTDLVRWDGSGPLERFRLMLPSGYEVHLAQSVHQIAATRDHIVILETGFKIGLQSVFNDPLPRTDVFERLARYLLTRPQLPYTDFYILSRADLDHPRLPPTAHGIRRIECQKLRVPLEADHFLADYDDSGGRITLHVGHSPATDLSEWIRPYDISAYDKGPIDPDLHGMLAVGAMDVGRLGRYEVEASTGRVLSSRTITDERTCWAVALYAGQSINTPEPQPDRIEQLYWCTEGVFPELLTEFVKDLYLDYPHRLVALETILEMGSTGRPSAIHRIDTASMTFADSYVLPDGVMAGSLQFVPRGAGPTDGYLVGTIYTDAATELWIFDAADLARGPIAKLASPQWKIGFSLHTAWTPTVEARTAPYAVSARQEIAEPVARLSSELAQRFEADLYPRFD